MKKHIYIALLCITSIAFSQEKKTEENATINTHLSLGRHGLDCSGRGACGFTKIENKKDANTTVTYNKNNTITLIIDRTKITKEDEVKIIGKQLTKQSKLSDLTFAMEDDFNLEPEIKSSLKMASQITKIAKGNYPIQTTKDHFTITLKLE